MTLRRICQKCRMVFNGNTCPTCKTSIADSTGLIALATARNMVKARKDLLGSKPKRKRKGPRPFANVPIKVLWKIQLLTQGALVQQIVKCCGDFELESQPALQELRKDLVILDKEFRKRAYVCPPKLESSY